MATPYRCAVTNYHRLTERPVSDRLKRLVYHASLEVSRRRRFTTLIYYLVYYPCFWWLERETRSAPHPCGWRGRRRRGRRTGRPERSREVEARCRPRRSTAARLLSDTFLLHDDAVVRAVPEPLLLDNWSRQWLGDGGNSLRAIAHRYTLGRNDFLWRPAT